MASIIEDFEIDADPDTVWAALRDFGALHERLARGFVVDTQLEGDVRTITFFNGMVARERLVGLDDVHRRLAYTVLGGRTEHHHAVAQVFAAGDGRSRFFWTTDVLPDAAADFIRPMMARGAEAMRQTFKA